MKFMHLSDVRLGLHNESGRRWGEERVVEVAADLRAAVADAAKEGTDLVLISGGLFAHRPVSTELDGANRIFASFPETAFVITAGENDLVKPSSPVISYKWADNVHYVLNGKAEKISFPAFNTAVYAQSVTSDEHDPEALIAISEGDEKNGHDTVRIALLEEPDTEKAAAFEGSGFSYIALGGQASHMELPGGKAVYSGGFEPTGMTDTGAHGYYMGEINETTGMLESVRFVPAASASYVPLKVKVGVTNTPEQVAAMIESEIRRRGITNIYRIRITGERKPEYTFEMADLRSRYRIAEVKCEAEPQYDFEALFEEHQQDMIGYFISSLRKNHTELSDIDKTAMFYGIDALIKTSSGKEQP